MMNVNMALSTRYRSDMVTLFDVFCEVGAGQPNAHPLILTKYPEDYNDDAVLKNIRHFSFPCGMKENSSDAVQLFCFVLTDSQSKYTFGYCRYTPRSNSCICLLSGFSWPNVFYKMLNHISLVMNNGTQQDLDSMLTRIYHTDIPSVGDVMVFECHDGSHKFEVSVPDINKLPTLRDDKFMLEFYNALSQRQMIAIYASLLKERRIIFTGRKLSQLSSCIYAASTLLFPMFWQFVFIPVLPEMLVDMVMAPMPFLIGVPKQVMENSNLKELGDVMIVDLEDKTLQSAHDDVSELPTEVFAFLKSQLKNSPDMGDFMSRSFLRANVLLFGGYRLGFVRNESTGVVHWDKEKFICEQRLTFQPFLSTLIGTDGVQFFERFIEERLRAINSGLPICDEFEREIASVDSKFKTQAVNQEALQQAVQSVKENASDVIGALKDRVTGIQIGVKLGKLTPREIRKSKNWSLKKTKNNGFEPMSFDNVQWQDSQGTSGSSREPSPRLDTVEAIKVDNLIDLDSPVESSIDSSWPNTVKFAKEQSPLYTLPSSSNHISGLITKPQSIPTEFTNHTASDPFFDPFKTPITPSPDFCVVKRPPNDKNTWETFD